jgi:N-acetylmuramoyl-L-alanine amidase
MDPRFFKFVIVALVLNAILGILYSFALSSQIERGFKSLNERVDQLETIIHQYETNNANLTEQLSYYESEINTLKNTISEAPVKESKIEPVDPDVLILAQLIEAESGNQSFEGKMAVGTVVMNRVDSGKFPNTIKDVIFQKNQFSVVANGRIYNKPSSDSLKAAKELMNGKRALSSSVLYFYNPQFVKTTNWIRSRSVIKRVGDHVFAI